MDTGFTQDKKAPISEQECEELARIMSIKYAALLKQRQFYVSCSEDQACSFVKVSLSNLDQSFFYPVEGRIQHKAQNLSAKEGALILCDYIDSYFEEYLDEDENIFLPIDWQDFSQEAINFQLKGQVLNLMAENVADKILMEDKSLEL